MSFTNLDSTMKMVLVAIICDSLQERPHLTRRNVFTFLCQTSLHGTVQVPQILHSDLFTDITVKK